MDESKGKVRTDSVRIWSGPGTFKSTQTMQAGCSPYRRPLSWTQDAYLQSALPESAHFAWGMSCVHSSAELRLARASREQMHNHALGMHGHFYQ